MRNIYKIIFVVFALSAISCDKWLDIVPEDTTIEKELFSDAGGYYSAINGIYQTIAGPELYGKNLTWGFASALSQNYDNSDAVGSKTGLEYYYTQQYDYKTDEVEVIAEEIWKTAYNVIANCNNVIQNIAAADSTIFPNREKGEMKFIEAEALAIRALMHFELIRLFAPAPVVDKSVMAIPYSNTFPDKFPKRMTTESVMNAIIDDLTDADALLEDIEYLGALNDDYIYGPNNRYLVTNSSMGIFFSARGVRMNNVAVKSLLARVYAYNNDLNNANKYASKVYKECIEDEGGYKYSELDKTGQSSEDRYHKLPSELLISFYNSKLSNIVYSTTMFYTSSSYGDNSYVLKNLDQMFHPDDVDDFRQSKLVVDIIGKNGNYKSSLKMYDRNDNAGGDLSGKMENKLLPIMKFSELRFIMAEYLAQTDDVPGAVAILNNHRVARGCVARGELDTAMAKADFDSELDKEIWKETISEGQYFYYCKRINAPKINNNGVFIDMADKYVLPIPNSEVSFN